jgi:hypothetical protein
VTRLATYAVVLFVASLVVSAASAEPGAETHPYKRGVAANVDGFSLRVHSVNTHGWPRIKAASELNAPPKAGTAYVLVTLRMTNRGKSPAIPLVNGVLKAAGKSKATYTPFDPGCGVIPSNIQSLTAVLPGKSVTANTCWQVKKSDVPSLLMFYESYAGTAHTYFALGAV